jgi:hypothetical protein
MEVEARSMTQPSPEVATKGYIPLGAVVVEGRSKGCIPSPRSKGLGCIEQRASGVRVLIQTESKTNETMMLAGVGNGSVE